MYDAHNVTKATEFSIHLVQQTEVLNLESDLYTVVHTVHYLLVHVGNNQHSFNISGHQVLFMVKQKFHMAFLYLNLLRCPAKTKHFNHKTSQLSTKHSNYL